MPIFVRQEHLLLYTCLCTCNHSISNFKIIYYSYLASQDNTVTKFRASSYTCLRGNQAAFSNNNVMSDLNKIIYFCSSANNSIIKFRPVNTTICPNFNKIFELLLRRYEEYVGLTVKKRITETVRADCTI